MKILVVDDDLLAAEMTSAILESCGFNTCIAEHAVAGLELLASEPGIGLIVSDMNMPLVSGIEFFRELRAQGNALPFVLLTGDDPVTLHALEPALNGCLTKDFDLPERLPALTQTLLSNPGH